MAETINVTSLTSLTSVQDSDTLLIIRSNAAYQIAASLLKGSSSGSTTGGSGTGIKSVTQTTTSSTDGGTNVITVTLTDGTTSTFSVKNGSKGSTGSTGESGVMAMVSNGTSNTTKTLAANTLNTWGSVSTLALTLGTAVSGKVSEYMVKFTAGSGGCTVTWPSGLTWAGGSAPTINAGKTYMVSIIEKMAVACEF